MLRFRVRRRPVCRQRQALEPDWASFNPGFWSYLPPPRATNSPPLQGGFVHFPNLKLSECLKAKLLSALILIHPCLQQAGVVPFNPRPSAKSASSVFHFLSPAIPNQSPDDADSAVSGTVLPSIYPGFRSFLPAPWATDMQPPEILRNRLYRAVSNNFQFPN
jgi:hypothetical protein